MFATVGSLLGKSLTLSDEVHQAMLSRGYRGDPKVLAQPRPALRDLLLVVAAAVFAAALLIGEHAGVL